MRWTREEREFAVAAYSSNGRSVVSTQRAFRAHFNLRPSAPVPGRQSIVTWLKTFTESGSALKKREGDKRPARTQEIVEAVRQAVAHFPERSVRKHAAALGISDATMRRILKDELKFNSLTILNSLEALDPLDAPSSSGRRKRKRSGEQPDEKEIAGSSETDPRSSDAALEDSDTTRVKVECIDTTSADLPIDVTQPKIEAVEVKEEPSWSGYLPESPGGELSSIGTSSLVDTNCDSTSQNESEDEDCKFFKSILPDFKKLNEKDKSMIKAQIKQLITWKLKNVT